MTTLLLPFPALALLAPGGVDWLYEITNNITELTTANGDALTSLGLTLLSFIALLMLVKMVIGFSTSSMTFSLSAQPLDAGMIVQFLMRLAFCCLLETYWTNPLPGAAFGFSHLFSYVAQQIVATLDQNSLATFNNLLNAAAAQTNAPSMFSPVEVACYYLVMGLMGIASAILFVINVSSFIFYAIAALFGPLFIPLYMTDSLRGKFYSFLEVLLSFAMIRAVASAFIFVWANFMNTFLQKTFHGDYSIEQWLANLFPVLMVFIAFFINMLFIPTITGAIFGGGATAAGSAQQLGIRILTYGVSKGRGPASRKEAAG